MINADLKHDIQVAIAPGGAHAALRLPAGFPRELVTVSYCRSVLCSAGVAVTDQVITRLNKLVASLPPLGEEVEVVVARRIDAVHGADAQIAWTVPADAAGVDRAGAPLASHERAASADTTKALDFYSCSAYTMVKKGDIVGCVTPAGAGEDGQDLAGRAIKAKAGRPLSIKLDETVLCDAKGRLIAQIDGVLRRTQASVSVEPVLEIQNYVDFSTGNIEFDGDVIVRRGVRACFTVKATGHVEVQGLVESTTVECGGTLTARGGIAGHERARIVTGENLVARYLDNVVGLITGDLLVEREAINCDLVVGGSAHMPHASLIGGQLNVTGDAEIGTLGSNAGIMTHVIFGSVPLLEAKRREVDQAMALIAKQQQALREEQQFLEGQRRSLSAQQKERMTEVMYELQQAEATIARSAAERKELDDAIEQRRNVRFTVLRKIHQGTRLTICGDAYRIDKDTAGPLSIGLSACGDPCFVRAGGSPLPLCQIARQMPKPRT